MKNKKEKPTNSNSSSQSATPPFASNGTSDSSGATKRSITLVPNVHYYMNEDGLMVFTAKYLQDRGYCCGSGCKHCPY